MNCIIVQWVGVYYKRYVIIGVYVFFSWRYVGQTQAWMPTCVSILCIPQMIWVWRATVEWYIDGKTVELWEKPAPVPLCPPQIPHGLTKARTRASAVRGRRLTTWAMALPLEFTLLMTKIYQKIANHIFLPETEHVSNGNVLCCYICYRIQNYWLKQHSSLHDARQSRVRSELSPWLPLVSMTERNCVLCFR
jgi:hypothetical protein